MRILSLCLLLCVACSPAPKLPLSHELNAEETSWSGLGAWVVVDTPHRNALAGELIEVREHDLLLLCDHGFQRIERSVAVEVRVMTGRSSASAAAGLATLGTISTLSHGYYLVFSAPLWIVGGAISSHEANSDVMIQTMTASSELYRWARFPQGMPEGLSEADLR